MLSGMSAPPMAQAASDSEAATASTRGMVPVMADGMAGLLGYGVGSSEARRCRLHASAIRTGRCHCVHARVQSRHGIAKPDWGHGRRDWRDSVPRAAVQGVITVVR